MRYTTALADPASSDYALLAAATHEGLDRMVMQSDLRDIYHGVHVQGYEPLLATGNGLVNSFYLQVSHNTKGREVFKVFQSVIGQH